MTAPRPAVLPPALSALLVLLVLTAAAAAGDRPPPPPPSGCPAGCATCSAMNGCVTCEKGLFLFMHRDEVRQVGICVHACPSGYYDLTISRHYKRCQRCQLAQCEACLSMAYCTRCSPPFMAYRGRCIESCPPQTYYAPYTKQCVSQVDCLLGAWSSWSVCQRQGKTCGFKYGYELRRRRLLQQPSPNALPCPQQTKYRECQLPRRTCSSDLMTNASEPMLHILTEDLMRKWRRRRRKRRRRLMRRRRRLRRQRGGSARHRGPGEKTRANQNKKHGKNRQRTVLRSKLHKKKLGLSLPDATTNQINVLLDAESPKKV